MADRETAQSVPFVVQRLHKTFASGRTKTLQWRRDTLNAVSKMIKENRNEILEAVSTDLGNPVPEFINVAEIGAVIQEIDYALAHLDAWVKPEPLPIDLLVWPAKAYIHKEPFGVCLIISPWNYPFRLLWLPAIGAIAAGNCVLLKPSEVSAHTSKVIKKLVDRYLDNEAIVTLEGGPEVSQALLKAPTDYIFYTGNTEIGKVVMRAAAEQLIPVTLELGGKSPVYVDADVNLDVAVSRIAFGKMMNAGQTCVAPDYILVHNSVKNQFVKLLAERWSEWYGPDFEASNYYSRIITSRHAQRLTTLLNESKDRIFFGGKTVPEKRFVQPSIVLDPSPSSELLKEEIFGPILPVVGVSSVEEAITIINSKPKPLALYVFTSNDATANKVINSTSSGGVGVNQVISHINLDAPFGGVGPSGMGSYNKKYSYETFTHRRTVLKKGFWPDSSIVYPPYTETKRKVFNTISDGIKLPTTLIATTGVVAAAAGAVVILSHL